MTQQLLDLVKAVIVRTPLYHLYVRARYEVNARNVDEWVRAGRPAPPPHPVKQAIVREYAASFRTRVFVETGTYFGDMVNAMLDQFDRIVSIELDPFLAQRAQEHFHRHPHVTIIRGDSATSLPDVLAGLTGSALFWLDGHYSSGVTARGAKNTPVYEEVTAILEHRLGEHVILIDDARDFGSTPGYPTIDQIKALVASKRPTLRVELFDDVIRIAPPRS